MQKPTCLTSTFVDRKSAHFPPNLFLFRRCVVAFAVLSFHFSVTGQRIASWIWLLSISSILFHRLPACQVDSCCTPQLKMKERKCKKGRVGSRIEVFHDPDAYAVFSLSEIHAMKNGVQISKMFLDRIHHSGMYKVEWHRKDGGRQEVHTNFITVFHYLY